MKKLLYIFVFTLGSVGCTASKPQSNPNLSLANPASVYCQQHGGKSIIQHTTQGDVGLCKLTNGSVVDEWELFRKGQTNCEPELAKILIGQKNLTELQIQQISKASIVRIVKPGQPVTMDYRVERVTVSVNPINKVIMNASCG
ncbi:hemolysin [Acinetobacter sp. ANC 5054]|uniref:I78 family peptidase inhibitor n=1 Tax=Acinetobacter sp. ANC 5054 TaxID=1977877 RepID=UPI000A34A5F6|nr:I78 family peptidase inhibitor [Acinetobacter sp. ANC 5054]OTG83288.1 hemolysin [Acinetobacter sp. ANC 5054]